METLTKKVEMTIQRVLSDKISLVFDANNADKAQYVAVFACFQATNHLGYRIICLALSSV